MKRFKSPRQVQRFLSTHDQGRGHRHDDGCVITPINRRHSTHRAFVYSIDDKLTVPVAAMIASTDSFRRLARAFPRRGSSELTVRSPA